MPASTRARRPVASAQAGSPIADYIAAADPTVAPLLEKFRALIAKEVPGADERISYRMPAFFLDGALIYFAPFKAHIGMYPPVKGDAALATALEPYRGEKGNLRFPLDRPMPWPLIRRVVRARLAEHRAHLATRRARR